MGVMIIWGCKTAINKHPWLVLEAFYDFINKKREFYSVGTPAIQETLAKGVNLTVFLGISNEGNYALMTKDEFFNHYPTLYLFKSFLERVWIKDPQWI